MIMIYKWYIISFSFNFQSNRSIRPNVFCKKGVLGNFTKFTGKHPCQSLFLNEVVSCKLIDLPLDQKLASLLEKVIVSLHLIAVIYLHQ